MAEFNDLEPKQYADLWDLGAGERKDIRLRQEYYDGKQAITDSNRNNVDGSTKSERVANFVKPAIDGYVGSIAGDPWSVTATEREDVEGESPIVNDSPATYSEISELNNFDTQDVCNTQNAYIAGWGIETHEFNDGEIVITARDPIQWYNVWDSNSGLLGTIHMSIVQKESFYKGELLSDELALMVVYTDTHITTFNKIAGENDGKWFIPDDTPPVPHEYGVPPVVIWRVNKDYASHITNDLIGQQDEYNETDSDSGDSLKFDSDGLLAIKGFASDSVSEQGKGIREDKIISLPLEGSVEFVQKATDFLRVESRIGRTREHIFMALGVPDIETIVGATGSTSGIALGLKFKPMQDNAKTMIAFLKQGVRDRIDLINAVVSKTSGTAIEDVQVNIEFDLPHNRIEEWKSIASVNGIVSHVKQLEMLSDVDDPEAELKRITRERELTGFIDQNSGTAEEIAARNDAEIAEMSIKLAPQIDLAIASITDAAQNAILKQTAGTQPDAE